MAFGPKSKQRKARVAREIKRFAQKHGVAGRAALVHGTATAVMPKAIAGWTTHVMNVAQPTRADKIALVRMVMIDVIGTLRRRGLGKRARGIVATGVGAIIGGVI